MSNIFIINFIPQRTSVLFLYWQGYGNYTNASDCNSVWNNTGGGVGK